MCMHLMLLNYIHFKMVRMGVSLVAQGRKSPPTNERDIGSIPDPGRSHMPWSN